MTVGCNFLRVRHIHNRPLLSCFECLVIRQVLGGADMQDEEDDWKGGEHAVTRIIDTWSYTLDIGRVSKLSFSTCLPVQILI